MLWNRIIGAFTFRKGVYAEVESDANFTQTAWLIVAVVAFLSQLGSYASTDIVGWLVGAVIATISAVIGFALASFIINWVGSAVFKADVTFEEMVRTLGLAYVWNIIGVLGIIGIISVLSCVVGPIIFIASILGLVAWFMAAKEALDLDWLQTIVTVILGWLAVVIIMAITSWVLGLVGLTTSAVGGLFGF